MSSTFDIRGQIFELESRLEDRKAELRELATMGTVITSIHEIDTVLTVVMDMAIRMVDGEVGMILLEENGNLKNKIAWGISEEFVKAMKYQDGMDIASYCLKIQETIILTELGLKNDDGTSIDTVISVPIKTSDECHGVMLIINKSGGGGYAERDKEVLEMLLSFVAVAIDNSRLIKHKLQKQKMEQEMSIARQIQETILPANIDGIAGTDIGAIYFPARDVGGDFYDVIKIDESVFWVVIGDVSNKGVPAALVMSAAAAIIRTIIENDSAIEVGPLAAKLNDILADQVIKEREMFVTLFFSKFDLKNHKLTYCNAGHMPGLLWSAEENKIVELQEGGTIVGQFAGLNFVQGERALNSGDRLFLYTDGLSEAADSDGNLFGRERVEQVFATEIDLSPDEFCKKVKGWVDRFAEGSSEEFHDDFTILQVKVL